MRRILAVALLTCASFGLAAGRASGQPVADRPLVDVLEASGVLDAQLAGYLVDRIEQANADGSALVVIQLDTAGALEIDPRSVVDAITGSRVPVAVWVGPRRAKARSAGALIVAAAHISGIGPSGTLGPLSPTELSVDPDSGDGRIRRTEELAFARSLSSLRDRGDPETFLDRALGANASKDARAVDTVVPSVALLLQYADGRTVRTLAGSVPVTLRIRSEEVDLRFFRPGPGRSLIHTFATTTSLVYLCLLAGAMLVAFEVFQPGLGVAGFSGAAVLVGGIYGMTVLPVGIVGTILFSAGVLLLMVDVALNELGLATIAGTGLLAYGSLTMFPAPAGALGVPGWLVGIGLVAALIYFVPVMTYVRRARRDPETQRAARSLVGMPGQVRSMLNPEGFVWVADALWRARSEDGTRLRVGEDVVVTGADGILLHVRRS
jgi:membrane-bound serine protease (ClpP class)